LYHILRLGWLQCYNEDGKDVLLCDTS